jgi:hypothetical protein
MDHKDVWLVLGLTVILAVAVSVSTVSLTGDAVFNLGTKRTATTPQLTCKMINSEIISSAACKNKLGREYSCVGATLIARVTHNGASSLFTMPIECDTPYSDEYANSLILENVKGEKGGGIIPTWAGDKDVAVTCCKIA